MMRYILLVLYMVFFQPPASGQSAFSGHSNSVIASGTGKGATVDVTWLSPKPVKIAFNNEEFFFTEGQKQRLNFYSGKPYSLKIIKPGRTYVYKHDLIFDNGMQVLTAAVVKDSLIISMPCKVINELNDEMVFVEGGVFTMGCTNKPDSDCVNIWKQQKIGLSAFYISKYDITQNQWEEVMGSNPSHFKNCSNCPVEMVSWNQVQLFITKLNESGSKHYRLPTEAEWEFAARGGNKAGGYIYSGGNNLDSVAWYAGNSGGVIHPVGQKKPNELGLYDMCGNVMEWCNDWYNTEYLSRRPGNNPLGGESGLYRIVRGSSWLSLPHDCLVLHRDWVYPGVSDGLDGFRLVEDR